jgi:pyruvate/2-oxoglutarate/acetoin dehydrogenase E1 component
MAVATAEQRCVRALNDALIDVFERRDDVYLLGEDVLDPYGGTFKVTQGLSTRWPERVLTTPISEAGLFGVAAGMALRGYRPILEIMFGDFITLGFDQIVNGIGKFSEMFDDQVRVPIVVRTPMGGGRGYGPTHSQSLEKLLLGVPGITVIAANECLDLTSLMREAVADDPWTDMSADCSAARPPRVTRRCPSRGTASAVLPRRSQRTGGCCPWRWTQPSNCYSKTRSS